jgi:hypothetical protein
MEVFVVSWGCILAVTIPVWKECVEGMDEYKRHVNIKPHDEK